MWTDRQAGRQAGTDRQTEVRTDGHEAFRNFENAPKNAPEAGTGISKLIFSKTGAIILPLKVRDAQFPSPGFPGRLNQYCGTLCELILNVDLLHVRLLEPRILMWLLSSFGKFVHHCIKQSLKMGLTDSTETSVWNKRKPRNNPEDGRIQTFH